MSVKDMLEIDVSSLVDERKGFKYLPWATAWKKFLEESPDSVYNVEKDDNGIPYFGNEKIGYICYTSITSEGITRPMHLPVLNGKKPILKPNMFDINTTVMRCLVKNMAMFGMGLDVYIGEDIPEDEKEEGLQSYTNKDKNKKTVDPLDGPGVESEDIQEVDNKNIVPKDKVKKKSAPKKEVTKKVTPDIDKKFEKAMKDQGYSEAKIKEHLGNAKINKMIKQQVINGKLDLAKK